MGLLRYQSTMGLNRDQIEELVTRVWQMLSCRPARRGRRPAVGLHRSVVLTLVLLRSNLNQATLADLEGVSQPTISRIFRRFAPLIEQALCLHLPPVPDAVAQRVVLIDGTLVPTGNRAGQEGNYAGKHRRAGLSVQVLADLTGGLLAVSTPRPGSMHDRRAFTETGFEALLAGTPTVGDLGYLGTTVITPRRKPPGGQLSTRDTDSNMEVSALRSAVERAIAHLKNWKILATGYRGRLTELPAIIRIVTTLEFYRLGW